MNIVHITPALPPTINGLGDFSKILVDNLKEKGFNKNSFLVVNINSSDKTITEPVVEFNKINLYEKLEGLAPDTIILHYVGYAYDRFGLPFYLYSALEKYKKHYLCKLLIFFHELYSSSYSPLKLPFYSFYHQKQIVKRLHNISYITFTNCQVYQIMLQKLLGKTPCNNVCTGIYSNISENLYDSKIKKTDNLIVVFGSYQRRLAVYQHPNFLRVLGQNKIKEIIDVGPGSILFNNSSINFIAKGSLPPDEVAALLNKARFGAIEYPADILGKSGIFSAYAAFGVIAINVRVRKEKIYDKLIEGINYFDADSKLSEADFEIIQKRILEWYSTRSTVQLTQTIENYLI